MLPFSDGPNLAGFFNEGDATLIFLWKNSYCVFCTYVIFPAS
jgi:hypothetical protein